MRREGVCAVSTTQIGLQTLAQDCTQHSLRMQRTTLLTHADGRLLVRVKSHQLTKQKPSISCFTRHKRQYKVINMWRVSELPTLYIFVLKMAKRETEGPHRVQKSSMQVTASEKVNALGLAWLLPIKARLNGLTFIIMEWCPKTFLPKPGCLA